MAVQSGLCLSDLVGDFVGRFSHGATQLSITKYPLYLFGCIMLDHNAQKLLQLKCVVL